MADTLELLRAQSSDTESELNISDSVQCVTADSSSSSLEDDSQGDIFAPQKRPRS